MDNTFINDLITKMTLDQKVGALFTLGFSGFIPKKQVYKYINEYHCGGLRLSLNTRSFGSYIDPRDNKDVVRLEKEADRIKYKRTPIGTASEYKKILDDLQEMAQSRPLGLPLHFSYDAEGGSSGDFAFADAAKFPKPMGLRTTNDKKVSYLVGKTLAEQARAVGFNWVHSPVLDVNSIAENPEIQTRAYSDNAEDILEYARETSRGLKEGGVIATAKHFPGRGHSEVDAHYEIPVIDVDKETMYQRELYPYKELIKEKLLPSIMIAHSIYPAFDDKDIATVSHKILTGLLREELNFEGVIVSDSMTMGSVARKYGVPQACAMFLQAGGDLVLLKAENSLVEETLTLVKEWVQEGKITEEDLNHKVYRVLSTKHEYGMFYDEYALTETPEEIFNQAKNKKLEKHIAKRSVLIAKGKENLPLSLNEKVLVVEQVPVEHNDGRWHSGILHENLVRLGANTDYIEADYRYDADDEEYIKNMISNYDKIIFTNYFSRSSLSNKEYWEEILKDYQGLSFVITNTPYKELSIPQGVDNIIITFATTPANIEVVAKTLVGKIIPEGTWPLKHYNLK